MTEATGGQVSAAAILGADDSGSPGSGSPATDSSEPGSSELQPAPEQRDRRADLLPEEQVVGSADPGTQAEVILEESLERTDVPDAAPDTYLERRQSEETA